MRILTGKKWRNGFLDYYRNPKEYRIQVLAWKNLERLENAYHTRPKSLRLLINYFPVVGPEGLIMKIWSRLREERRNQKYVSCGVGKIIESADKKKFAAGELVGFVTSFHPPLAERITLPEKLISKIDKSEMAGIDVSDDAILYSPLKNGGTRSLWWKVIKGWSVYSGIEISEKTRKQLADSIKKEIRNNDWLKSERVSAENPSPVLEIKEAGRRGSGEAGKRKKTGVLFGYGNYAKINIIPYSKPFVDIQAVHEVDPTQIFLERGIQKWDSSPFPRPDEKYEVYFVASYNHTHIPITLHALRQNAYAVVEKPVVMDYEELKELEKALKTSGRKIFIGFHKRYGTFNKLALKDLGLERGKPVSYHSIVYELLQPEFFWYNWPVSRSTFFANGCHQIDHFFHLNNFSRPRDFDIKLLQDNAVEVWIELENGATFTTTFSEKGSLRVGPRDHVELKVPGRNVRITDAIRYVSEDNSRIIRKKKVFKTDSYKDMYRTIGRKIANNEEGDTIESIMISAKIMLDLEEKLQKMKGWGGKYKKAKEEFLSYFK